MKITCQSCGHENELGRIFCGSCGKKLDMSQMSMQNVARESRTFPWRALLKWTGIVLAVVIVVGGGLALLARPPLQEGAPPAGAARVRNQLAGTQNAIRQRSATTVSFAARDINAYLVQFQQTHRLLSLTADVQPGAMRVRAIGQFGPWPVGSSFEVPALKYSYEVRCVPSGSGYSIKSASMGRLPMPGPLAAIVRGRFAVIFANARAEPEILKHTERIEFETDMVQVAIRP